MAEIYTRREFLKLAAVFAAGGAVGCRPVQPDTEAPLVEGTSLGELLGQKTEVGVRSVTEAETELIAQAGGIVEGKVEIVLGSQSGFKDRMVIDALGRMEARGVDGKTPEEEPFEARGLAFLGADGQITEVFMPMGPPTLQKLAKRGGIPELIPVTSGETYDSESYWYALVFGGGGKWRAADAGGEGVVAEGVVAKGQVQVALPVGMSEIPADLGQWVYIGGAKIKVGDRQVDLDETDLVGLLGQIAVKTESDVAVVEKWLSKPWRAALVADETVASEVQRLVGEKEIVVASERLNMARRSVNLRGTRVESWGIGVTEGIVTQSNGYAQGQVAVVRGEEVVWLKPGLQVKETRWSGTLETGLPNGERVGEELQLWKNQKGELVMGLSGEEVLVREGERLALPEFREGKLVEGIIVEEHDYTPEQWAQVQQYEQALKSGIEVLAVTGEGVVEHRNFTIGLRETYDS